jgi:hypothetical protein
MMPSHLSSPPDLNNVETLHEFSHFHNFSPYKIVTFSLKILFFPPLPLCCVLLLPQAAKDEH